MSRLIYISEEYGGYFSLVVHEVVDDKEESEWFEFGEIEHLLDLLSEDRPHTTGHCRSRNQRSYIFRNRAEALAQLIEESREKEAGVAKQLLAIQRHTKWLEGLIDGDA